MNTLVTGASGFLGRAILNRLRLDTPVIAQSFSSRNSDTTPCDLRDPAQLADLIRRARPGVVVHAAAYRDPDFCETHPEETQRLNVDAVRGLVATLPPEARLLFISSDYVFDGTCPPYTETAPRRAISLYGASKIAAEDAALSRPNSLVLRIPLLIGAGPTWDASGFLAQLAATVNDPTPCRQDDVLLRYPTWIEDVAAAIAFLLRQNAAGIFHYSGPEAMTRYQSALAMAALLDRSADHIHPSHDVIVRPAARPHDSHLATGRIRALGFTRATPFTEVARTTLQHFTLLEGEAVPNRSPGG